MNITYNETDQTIEIDDNLKWNQFLIKFLMICNIIQGVMWPLKQENGFMTWFWILLGSFSLGMLMYFFFRKSTAERIAVDQVVALEKRNLFGRMQYFLKLKNGKERDLMGAKHPKEIGKLWDLMMKIGVQVV